jgi:probable rRNA maturation factor
MIPRVEVTIESGDWSSVTDIEPLVSRAVSAAASETGLVFAPGAEVSLLFTDDTRIRALNAAWRGIDKATNVLSFASGEPVGEAVLLGDIAIAFATVRAEAEAQHKSFVDHLTHLIVHGFLHLVGFDHEIDVDAEAMEDMECAILARLGIEDPYRDIVCHELE